MNYEEMEKESAYAVTDLKNIVLITDESKKQILLKKMESFIEIERIFNNQKAREYYGCDILLHPDKRDEVFENLRCNPYLYEGNIKGLKEFFKNPQGTHVKYDYKIKEEKEKLKNTPESYFPYFEDNENSSLTYDKAHKIAVEVGSKIAESYNVKLVDASEEIFKLEEETQNIEKLILKEKESFYRKWIKYNHRIDELTQSLSDTVEKLKGYDIYYRSNINPKLTELEEKDKEIAEKDKIIKEKERKIAYLEEKLYDQSLNY